MLSAELIKGIFHGEGTTNALFNYLPYCTDRMDYVFSKLMCPDISISPRLFLNDINIQVTMVSEETLGMINIQRLEDDVFQKMCYEPDTTEAPMKLIETLLDDEKIILVQTVAKWLPFFKYYDEAFDANLFTPGHVFMVIGRDEDAIYYIEAPQNIKQENFISCGSNHEVGRLDKEVLKKAISHYLRCFVYNSSKEQILKKIKQSYIGLIKTILNTYYAQKSESDGNATYVGRNALMQMIRICQKGNLSLNTLCPLRKNLRYSNLMEWQFKSAASSRSVWKMYFEENSIENKKIIKALNESISCWDLAKNIIIKNEVKSRHEFDQFYIPYFTNILKSEENLMLCFENILKDTPHN